VAFLDNAQSGKGTLMENYGWSLSLFAAALICLHWIPQIYETCELRSLGSLSLAMLIIQAIGCILTLVNVSSAGFIVGMPYLIASCMMCILCGMSWVFSCDDRSGGGTTCKGCEADQADAGGPGHGASYSAFIENIDTMS